MQAYQESSPIPYPNPLRHWNSHSWIRSKPLRSNAIEGYPFPPELTPLLRHPLVSETMDRKLKAMAYRLLAHLKFTTVLELEHVNPVCSDLARGLSRVSLQLEEKNDALRIYCDEGGHALFVELLSKAIEDRYNISGDKLGLPYFHLEIVRIINENQHIVDPILLKHFFVAVSETLVTKILRDIPLDKRVSESVREVIGDHANDEATHSVYFRWYFPRLWNAITDAERNEIGKLLPKLVWAFLGPDYEVDRRVLNELGLNKDEIDDVLNKVHTQSDQVESVRQAAKPTLDLFIKAGVFNNPQAKEAFIKYGLLPEVKL